MLTKSTYRGISQATIEAKLRKYERYAKIKFLNAIKEQQKELIEQIKQANSISEITNMNIEISETPVKNALTNVYMVTGADFADATIKQIENQESKEYSKDVYMQWMKEYVERETGKRITLITNTTKDQFIAIVKREVDKGIADGLGIENIAKNIQQSIGISNKYRAVRIAQTEVIGASNAGSFEAAKSVRIPMEKGWVTSGRKNVRHSHDEMDNTWVDMNSLFKVPIYKNDKPTGSFDYMLHPGHAGASAGNVINCHCTIIYRRKLV